MPKSSRKPEPRNPATPQKQTVPKKSNSSTSPGTHVTKQPVTNKRGPQKFINFYVTNARELPDDIFITGRTSLSREKVRISRLAGSEIKLFFPVLNARSFMRKVKDDLSDFCMPNIKTGRKTQQYKIDFPLLEQKLNIRVNEDRFYLIMYLNLEKRNGRVHTYNRFCKYYRTECPDQDIPPEINYNNVVQEITKNKQGK